MKSYGFSGDGLYEIINV